MRYIGKRKVPKALTAWLLVLSMVLATVTTTMVTRAAITDYDSMSMSDIMSSQNDLTWVFAGDSITHNATYTAGMNGYAEWFEQYLNTNNRSGDSVVITAWGGADIYDFQTEADTKGTNGIKEDAGMGIYNMVTKYNPDVISIKIGMNDRYKTTKEYVTYYEKMLDSIYTICKDTYSKIPKIIINTPTPISTETIYDDTKEQSMVDANWDSTLRHCKALEKIVEKYNDSGKHMVFCNLREAFMDAQLELGDEYFATIYRYPSDGGLHPNGAGQYLMFKTFAKALGIYSEEKEIFQYEYEDINSCDLFADVTSNIIYDDYSTVSSTDDDVEMNKTLKFNDVTLLASIDFNSQNGVFHGTNKYSTSTQVSLTDASVCQDTLTLDEAKSLEREFSVIFRAKLDSPYNMVSANKNYTQPVLFLSPDASKTETAGALRDALNLQVGTQNNTDSVFYQISSSSEQMKKNGGANTFDVDSGSGYNTVDGEWHTIAIVQSEDVFSYYIDGVKVFSNNLPGYKTKTFKIGDLFKDATKVEAHIGGVVAKNYQTSYNLRGLMDYYQFYKGALSDEQVKVLTQAGGSTTTKTDAEEMSSVMPKADNNETVIASIDFDSTTGNVNTTNKANVIDLTAMGDKQNPLTKEEATGLTDNKISFVFRAKLNSGKNENQPLVTISANGTADWNSALAFGIPGKINQLYYGVRFNKDKTEQSANSVDVSNGKNIDKDGKWHTVVVVVDAGTLYYYVDGVLMEKNTKFKSTSTYGSLFENATNFCAYMGSYGTGSNSQYKQVLIGQFDYLQIYKGALNSKTITNLTAVAESDEMNAIMPNSDLVQFNTVAEKDFTSANGKFKADTKAEITLKNVATMNEGFSVSTRAKLTASTGSVVEIGDVKFQIPKNYADSKWHTFTFVQSKNEQILYVDGTKVSTTANALATINDIKAIFGVGITGYVDYCNIYGKTLTEKQAAAITGDVSSVVESKYGWDEVLTENFVWTVAGAEQLMGYETTFPNRSLYRLLDNTIRRTSYRDIRLTDISGRDYTISKILEKYDNVVKQYNTDVFMLLPEVSQVYKETYTSSIHTQIVSDYKTAIQTLLTKNKDNGIITILWTPLASNNTVINAYINDYAKAVRELAVTNDVMFFDANQFMKDNMEVNESLVRNWFTDDMFISELASRDLIYAFCRSADRSGIVEKNKTSDELSKHNLRYTSDARVFKGNCICDLLEAEIMVNAEKITVDVTKLKTAYPDVTEFEFVILPFKGAGTYNRDNYVIDSSKVIAEENRYTFTAPCSDPVLAIYGKTSGKQIYHFADMKVELTVSNDLIDIPAKPDGAYLDSLKVVGAEDFTFAKDTKEYNVTLYSYQRFVQVCATAQDGLEITVDGKKVISGENSGLITVDTEKEVTVQVSGKVAGVNQSATYTLKLTRPAYPDIIITEVMTDANYLSNVTGDEYELIEIYNTTDRTLNLNDYSIGDKVDYVYTGIKSVAEYPNYYFTGNNTGFGSRSDSARKYTGINQITKYSSYWNGTVTEPDTIPFPANSTMVVWIKWNGETLEKSSLINDLKNATDYVLHVNGKAVVPEESQIVIAEIPSAASTLDKKGASNGGQASTTKSEDVSRNFYLNATTSEAGQDGKTTHTRRWMFVLKDSAVRAENASITETGNDIISAAKFFRIETTNKLSSVFAYNVDRGMSLVKDEQTWDTDYSKGHTSYQQGYANLTSFGAIEYWQKPYDLADAQAPKIMDKTEKTVLAGKTGRIELELSDETDLRYLELHVKKAGETDWTVIREDYVLQASVDNKGVSVDVKNKVFNYSLGEMSGDVQYYGFVVDGNRNKTAIGTDTTPCTVKYTEGGKLDVAMSIKRTDGEAVATTVEADVIITVGKGTSTMELDTAYDVMSGTKQVGTINMLQGKLTGTFTLKHGESIYVKGLPGDAKYTVKVTTPKGYALATGETEQTGNIVLDQTSNVSFTLAENAKAVGSLNVQMSIADQKGDGTKAVKGNVTIEVEKGTATGNLAASYVVMKGTAQVGTLTLSGDKLVGIFAMADGEELTILGLPDGVTYKVTMEVPDRKYQAVGSVTQTGTHSATGAQVVYMSLQEIPLPTGNATISMSIGDLQGNAAADTVKAEVFIKVTMENGSAYFESVYDIMNGTTKVGELTLKGDELTGKITMKHGDTVTISGLPQEAVYQITATVPHGYLVKEGTSAEGTGTITATEANIQFELCEKEPAFKDMQIQVSIKEADGTDAAGNVKGKLTISIDKGRALSDFIKAVAIYNGNKKVGMLSLKGDKLSATIVVKNGDALIIKGLPEYVKYALDLSVGGEEQSASATGTVSDNTTVTTEKLTLSRTAVATDNPGIGSSDNDSSKDETSGNQSSGVANENKQNDTTVTSKNTGDHTQAILWGVLLIVALGVLVVFIIRKKNDQEA